jgi:hypothetical protein
MAHGFASSAQGACCGEAVACSIFSSAPANSAFDASFPASAQLDPSGSVPDAVLLEASALLSDQS